MLSLNEASARPRGLGIPTLWRPLRAAAARPCAVARYHRQRRLQSLADLLEKLVAFMGVQEFGTNYPAELYDPNGFGKEEYYEKLEPAFVDASDSYEPAGNAAFAAVEY